MLLWYVFNRCLLLLFEGDYWNYPGTGSYSKNVFVPRSWNSCCFCNCVCRLLGYITIHTLQKTLCATKLTLGPLGHCSRWWNVSENFPMCWIVRGLQMPTMRVVLEMQQGLSPCDTPRAFARRCGCPQHFHAEDVVVNSQADIMASSHSSTHNDIAAKVVWRCVR